MAGSISRPFIELSIELQRIGINPLDVEITLKRRDDFWQLGRNLAQEFPYAERAEDSEFSIIKMAGFTIKGTNK